MIESGLSAVGRFRTVRGWAAFIPAIVFWAICGCSSNAAKPVVTITDPSGAALSTSATTLSIDSTKQHTVSLVADVTHDAEGLGADWTATCTSPTPGVGLVDDSSTCGSFSNTHTASGPVPSYTTTTVYVVTYTAPSSIPGGAGTVTITANATSLPSSASSITLTITK